MVNNSYGRWLLFGVSFCIFLVVTFYYTSVTVRKSAASRIITIVDAVQVNVHKMHNKDAKRLVQLQYQPHIRQAIDQYERWHGYWKDIYKTNLAIAVHYYHSGRLTQALKTLKNSIHLNPFFINFFDAAKVIYHEAGLTGKVEECKRILKSLSQDSGDGMLPLKIRQDGCI